MGESQAKVKGTTQSINKVKKMKSALAKTGNVLKNANDAVKEKQAKFKLATQKVSPMELKEKAKLTARSVELNAKKTYNNARANAAAKVSWDSAQAHASYSQAQGRTKE